MKKFNLKLPRSTWGQLKTKYPVDSEFVQDDDFTTGTKNLDTTVKGVITKRKGSIPYNPTPLTKAAKDQYEAIFEDGIRHLLAFQNGELKYSPGDGTFNSIVNGTGFLEASNFQFATVNNKVYMGNGINNPQVYDRATSYGGASYTAPQLKQMGAQSPTSAPTLSSQTGAGLVPQGSYRYKYTFVYYDNEESNPSPASAVITAGASGSDITMSLPTGGYGVTKRNLYRSVDGLNDYLWVASIDNNIAPNTVVDDQPAGSIAIPDNHDVPPTFGGITIYQEAVWLHKIAGEPFTLRYSNKGQPDIMPDKNYLICNQQDPLVGTVVFKGRLIVFNRNSMGQVLGTNYFNYQYQEIQGSVGCVDERSIQVRTIRGIPTLVWLSDKGVYSYNGNSVDYISDAIEDLINFNIQQAQFNKGKQEFSSDSEFNNLTRSDGIIVSGGALSTVTPYKNYSSQIDWDHPDATVNDLATSQGINTIKSLADKTFGRTESGSVRSGNLENDGGVLELPTKPKVDAENYLGISGFLYDHGNFDSYFAQPLQRSQSGTYTNYSIVIENFYGVSRPVRVSIHTDVAGAPAQTPLYQSGYIYVGYIETINVSYSYHAAANEKIWVVVEALFNGNSHAFTIGPRMNSGIYFSAGKVQASGALSGPWRDPILFGFASSGVTPKSMALSYGFNQDVTSKSGSWQSAEYDTQSIYNTGQITYNHTTALNSSVTGNTSTVAKIQGSNTEIAPRSFTTVHTLNNPSVGAHSFTPGTKYRYWRVIVEMNTDDNRYEGGTLGTPRMTADPSLEFQDSGTWESGAFFTSTDVTSFDSLTSDTALPGQVVLEIATAPDSGGSPGTFSAYSSIGSATPQAWAKIRATLTTSGGTQVSVGEITFSWSVESTAEVLSTTPINTTQNNVGWNVFIATVENNGGSTQFEMQSNASDTGYNPFNYVSITPAQFPSGVAVNQYAWWKVTISSSGQNVPVIDAVIPQWYLGTTDSIRVASLFYNRTYYLAAATFGSSTNNTLIVYDGEDRWRVYEDININTIGLFFNDPYYGSADDGTFYKFLEGNLDKNTTNIDLDLRTRAFDFGKHDPAASDKVKLIKQVEIRLKHTGAAYQVFYSVDEGETFYPMYTDNDQTSYQTTESGEIEPVRFRVDYDAGNPISGRTIMIRVRSNDAYEAQIHNIRFKGFIREADVINVAQ